MGCKVQPEDTCTVPGQEVCALYSIAPSPTPAPPPAPVPPTIRSGIRDDPKALFPTGRPGLMEDTHVDTNSNRPQRAATCPPKWQPPDCSAMASAKGHTGLCEEAPRPLRGGRSCPMAARLVTWPGPQWSFFWKGGWGVPAGVGPAATAHRGADPGTGLCTSRTSKPSMGPECPAREHRGAGAEQRHCWAAHYRARLGRVHTSGCQQRTA